MITAERLRAINGAYSRLCRLRSLPAPQGSARAVAKVAMDRQREAAAQEVLLTMLGMDPDAPKLLTYGGPREVA